MPDDLIAPSESNQEEVVPDKTEDTTEPEKTVPYERFKAVNERLKAAEKIGEDVTELRRELQELKEKQTLPQTGDYGEDEVQAGDRIDRFLRERKGFLTKDDLEREQRINKRAALSEKLSDKYNGKNGYPKFETDEIVSYARSSGFGDNLESAYKALHMEAIIDVEAKRKVSPPPDSEKPTSAEREVSPGLTPENIANMSPAEFAKHEAAIDAAMKAKIANS